MEVLKAVENDGTNATALARGDITDPAQALAGCDAFLDMACDAEVRQIILRSSGHESRRTIAGQPSP